MGEVVHSQQEALAAEGTHGSVTQDILRVWRITILEQQSNIPSIVSLESIKLLRETLAPACMPKIKRRLFCALRVCLTIGPCFFYLEVCYCSTLEANHVYRF